MTRRRQYVFSILLFAATAFWAAAQPSPDELEENRRRLATLRTNADQMARLRGNLQQFLALPEKKQSNLVQLDHDLHDWPAAKKERYLAVLERYADWLEQLRQQDLAAYKLIKDAPNAESRLVLIKEQRDREWMQSQPKAYREEWAKLAAEQRGAYVAKLRQDERTRHQQWVIAQRFWKELESKKEMPCRLSDFARKAKKKDSVLKETNKVKDYVTEYLMPFLSNAEKEQLARAEGRWPDFPQALVEIASKHPSALPPPRKEYLPLHFDKLPKPIQARLLDKKGSAKSKKELKPFDAQPQFINKVVELATNKGSQPFDFEFWASYSNALQPPMKEFVAKQLIPKLDTKEKANLEYYEGKWPYYPQTIDELAQKYQLRPPWHILPEPEEWKWDNYRYLKRRPPDLVKDQPES